MLTMNKKIKWLHIVWDFYDYTGSYWLDWDFIKSKISEAIKSVWLSELWSYYHFFWKDSYSWVICLAESHVSIHTWPESSYLTLDIYVCNFWNDNTGKAFVLLKFFENLYKPRRMKIKHIYR